MRQSGKCDIPATEVNTLNEIFKNMLAKEQFLTITGDFISLSTYLREGLMLIHYYELMEELGVPPNDLLKSAFDPYQRHSEAYLNGIRTVAQILCKFCVIMTDWSSHIFVYNINLLWAFGTENSTNEIGISTVKPEIRILKLEDHSRELLRVGWSGFEGTVNWASIAPHKLGFKCEPYCTEPANIYIQRHALQRLQERVGLVPGLMQEAVFETFRNEEIFWHKRSEKRLVEYRIMEKKIGYLVCSMDQGTIIIRSFLFLTNSGTPEGNKLSELTRLAPLDKQYLGIDTLLGFAGFEFSKDPSLVELFTQAGCADLLNLSTLTKFTKSEVKGQDAELLLKYLTGIFDPDGELIETDDQAVNIH